MVASHGAGLILHTSNRLERLAESLAKVLSRPLSLPLTPEIVVVQSNGMRRWVTQQIALRNGICSNVRFPFPQNFFHDLFLEAFPQSQGTGVYGREAMTWRIMKLLPKFVSEPAFVSVANYLAGSSADFHTYELARKIAIVFDQYLVFRPRMILDWDAGKEDGWQPVLWRELQRAAPRQHQPALALQLIEALQKRAPERVSIFGVSSLPPFYVSLIEEIAARCPVHLFIMEPTPEWWGDIRSRREKSRGRQPELFQFEGEEDIENVLLAENGRVGREFLNIIADLNPAREQQDFEKPADDTILHGIQRDIFELSATASHAPRDARDDRSLQIHSCHSAVRELEVLHDQLLALLADDASLNPRDIVVMMPDVSAYAPFIEAVFGVPENPEHFIPYSIADRVPRARSGVIDTFIRVLETLPGRFGASEIFALLESSALQRKFSIAPSELEKLRGWIDECAVRWGIDADHRARLGLPRFPENSWRQGLDRMLLGYSMQPASRELFGGILPFNQIEGSDAELLGNLVELIERLFSRANDFANPRPLPVWQSDLLATVDEFLDADEPAQLELNQLRAALAELGDIRAASGNNDPVLLEIVVMQLGELLEQGAGGAGFLTGAMTFCALKPMRSIPFKVVCLLGMNDTAYPRRDARPGFDLIGQHRQRGDPDIRAEDRSLFLEALLSARDVFYLSFVGQSMRDNSPLPPSVVVSELEEYIVQRFALGAESIVVKNSLQAFSPRNFGAEDSRCFSYSLDNSAAGEVAGANRHDPAVFFRMPLAAAEDKWREVEIAELVDFFSHPSKFFLRHRLAIDLPSQREEIDDREPFTLHPLHRYGIEQQLLADALEGREAEGALALVRGAGILPPGATGDLIFEELCASAGAFAGAVRDHVSAEKRSPTPIRASVNGFDLTGTIDRIRGNALVHFRLAKLKAKDFLRIWIEHLARNVSGEAPAVLFGMHNQEVAGFEFPPVRNASEMLADLLALYWSGLSKPLPLFPRTSWAFAEKIAAGKSERDARYAATQIWWGNQREGRGEREDSHVRLAFRGVADPLGQEWEKITRSVLMPIFSNCRRR